MDSLKLENQLCFPLYACARGIVKKYTPFLNEIGLTYTQYITLMVLWEEKQIGVKKLGEKLFLDSGTLTPLLKKLEKQGLVTRERSKDDERNLIVTITARGAGLKKKARPIPAQLGACIKLNPKEAGTLYTLLYKLLDQM
jgi:DNA-binding MarR family transcriptional regulator